MNQEVTVSTTGRGTTDIEHWLKWAQESGYDAELLAKRVGVSRWQLQRYTRATFGNSPQRWLNERRLIAAVSLLKELRSVKIVAAELGFKQVSHFSREFKRFHGASPTKALLISSANAHHG
jgi:AraC-like DNA-binding protein